MDADIFILFTSLCFMPRSEGLDTDSFNTWETRYDNHMFRFGPQVGDEKLESGFPVVKDAYRKPFDKIKIFLDGHVELENSRSNPRYTPFIAPFHLPYSEVTSGHVWYRETSDAQTLALVKSEINSAFAKEGLKSDPEAIIILTWQFENVTTHYPECEAVVSSDYKPLCDCLEAPYFNSHIECECLIFSDDISNVCPCLYNNPSYRYCACTGNNLSGIAFDWSRYCTCESRGKPGGGVCSATTYNGFQSYLPPVEACDFCECRRDSRLGYCHCRHVSAYQHLTDLSCILLFVAGVGECLELEGHSCIPLNVDTRTGCEDEPFPRPSVCDCVLPGSLNEQEMTSCLLGYGYHDYIWVCDEPDHELPDYCACIKDRTPDDVNDEIYCKCLASGQSFCECLAANDYGGTESCTGVTRAIRSSNVIGSQNVEAIDLPLYMNTFQAAIVYNSYQSFVYFTYQKLEYYDMHVTTQLGYTDGDEMNFVYTHPYPRDPMLRHFLLFDSNMAADGRWLYKMDRTVTQPTGWTPKSPELAPCSGCQWSYGR